MTFTTRNLLKMRIWTSQAIKIGTLGVGMAIYVCTSSLGRLGYLLPAVQTLLSLVLIFYRSVVCRGEAGTLEDGVISSLPRTETEITCFFSNGENPEAPLKGRQR